MKLENGRPENTEGRLEKEIRVYDFLDKLGVEYQRVDHEAAMTMEACEEIDRTLGDGTAICKNLFLCNRQETDFYLLLMPGDKPFKTKNLSAQIGSARLSFAKPEYVENFMRFIAQELREYMARLGIATIDEMVGRTDLLTVSDSVQEPHKGKVDLSAILNNPYAGNGQKVTFDPKAVYNFELEKTLDEKVLLKK